MEERLTRLEKRVAELERTVRNLSAALDRAEARIFSSITVARCVDDGRESGAAPDGGPGGG